MKKFTKFIPAVTLLTGLVCGVLRGVLFESMDERGLLPAGHLCGVLTVVLLVLTLAMLVANLFVRTDREYRFSLNLPVQAVGCFAAAIANLYWLFTYDHGTTLQFLKLLSAGCFLALAVYRAIGKKPPLLLFALVCIGAMGLCFGQYRQWGRHTQLQEYLFPALSSLLIALYSLEFCNMELPESSGKKAFFLNQAALFSTLACIRAEQWPYYLLMSLWLISGLFTTVKPMILPPELVRCMNKLEKAGYQVYVVGGCVRDSLMGLQPADYDLCTNATPEQICQVFDGLELVRNGEKHGTIGVVWHHKLYEITTFRTEGSYSDNRHPDAVQFVTKIEEDLSRRDFTVNAIAYHPKKGYVDPYGGRADIQKGIIRAVGDPETRFQEDALRILRGVRFACRFRMQLDAETEKAMEKLAPLLNNLAVERVYTEVTKILCSMEQGDLIKFRMVLLQVIPELQDSVGFQQHTHHHAYDVFTHTDYVLTATARTPVMRWAALLHDAGKPQVFSMDEKGNGHFYGHAGAGTEIARSVLLRLRFPTAVREQVLFLIQHHMDDDIYSSDPAALRRKLSKYGLENLNMLIDLQEADFGGKGVNENSFSFAGARQALQQLAQEEGRLQIRDLAVDGHDLMAIGYTAGPELGNRQKILLDLVLSGSVPNDKEALLEKARQLREDI